MLNEVDGEDVPVLMDFGSMGPARCEIKGLSEARALQVVSQFNFFWPSKSLKFKDLYFVSNFSFDKLFAVYTVLHLEIYGNNSSVIYHILICRKGRLFQ